MIHLRECRLSRAGRKAAAAMTLVALAIAVPATAASQRSTKEIRSKFSLILKDPSSLQLDVVSSKLGVICGRYNSKNSYGGYVGFKNFTYQEGTLYTVGTIVRPDGTISDVDAVTHQDPTDVEGLTAMIHDTKSIMDEYEAAFKKC
jgi:hypothetical protein